MASANSDIHFGIVKRIEVSITTAKVCTLMERDDKFRCLLAHRWYWLPIDSPFLRISVQVRSSGTSKRGWGEGEKKSVSLGLLSAATKTVFSLHELRDTRWDTPWIIPIAVRGTLDFIYRANKSLRRKTTRISNIARHNRFMNVRALNARNYFTN